jgi:hypothetical protein
MNTTTPLIATRRSDDLLDLPGIVHEVMAGEPALDHHVKLAGRYRELVTKTTELGRELEQARREDDARRREALASGAKPAKPKAPEVEAALKQARHDVGLLDASVRESMQALATAAIPYTDAASAELTRRRQAAEQRLRDLFAAAESALDEHAKLAGEAVWVAALRLSGRVAGYRAGAVVKTLRRTGEEVRSLSLALDEDLRRQGEVAAQAEREEAVAKPLPPGTRIWRGAETLVVDEAGEAKEVK